MTQLAVAAALVVAAGSASAADLYGGGATFPVQAYVGNNFLTFTPDRRLSRNIPSPPAPVNPTTAAANSFASLTSATTVFGAYALSSSNRISYCQTGSGTGKTLLVGAGTITNANGKCGDFSGLAADAVAGFSGNSVNGTAAPDYIGTDSPITQADATSFTAGPRTARNGLFQIPTIAGSIALPRSNNLSYGNLTISQVCQIYSARITNWSAIEPSVDAPIRVVYRSDGSGTSFAFTSYLAAACNGNFGIPAGYFKPNQSYAAAVPAVPGQPGSAAPLYAASASASGNPGVVSNVIANTNSTSYADYAEVAAQSAEFPNVNTISPATPTLSGTVTIPASAALSGQVLNASNVPVAVTGIANPNCIRLINPSTIPTGVTYPILAYTYIDGYFGGNTTNVAALKSLTSFFLNNPAVPTNPNRPALPAGFAYLDGSDTYRNSIQNTINTCIS